VVRRERRVRRHPEEIRSEAIRRVKNGERLVDVARDMDVHKRLIYAWIAEDKRAAAGTAAKPRAKAPEPGYESLRRENQQLKQALANKTLEIDFFKGALQKIEARRQSRGKTGGTASTPKSGR
jgi:transposase-like protein